MIKKLCILIGSIALMGCGGGFATPQEDGALIIGDINAPYTVEAFLDYQCPRCREFDISVYPRFKETLIDTGRVKLKVFDFPTHPSSPISHNAVWCAAERGKFEEYMHLVFQKQAYTKIIDLTLLGESIGLDQDSFRSCIQEDTYTTQIERNKNLGRSRGVGSTPTFFVGDQKLDYVPTVTDFEKYLGDPENQ